MIRALIFDYFGVIRPDGIHRAYRELGGDPEKDIDFIRDTLHSVNHGFITSSRPIFAERLGVTEEVWTEAVTGRYQHDAELLAYIIELRKQYKTALLSNIGPGGLQLMWPPGELEKYFDVAIASGDEGVAKPDRQAYELAASRLRVHPEECVMIDDIEGYCDGARVVGMQAICYQHFEQAKQELEQLLKR